MSMAPPPTQKISVDLFEDDIRDLDSIASARGTNRTEALRGAIASEKYFRDLLSSGAELYYKQKGSSTLQRLVLR